MINDTSVYGGSIFDIPKNVADHYFLLDGGIKTSNTSYVTVHHIPNWGVPKDIHSFNQCLEKAAIFVNEGCPIFVGCLGGHGRTGLFLSILLFQLTKDRLSLYNLREQYCYKAVETTTQYKFLMDYGLEIYALDYKRVKEKEEQRRTYGKKPT
jgi:protein-tyrosine phosphatase